MPAGSKRRTCSIIPVQWDSGKITALKTATNNLLTQLKNPVVNDGDVYVSIIPFVKDINVDPVNYNQLWINWTECRAPAAVPNIVIKAPVHRTARSGRLRITILLTDGLNTQDRWYTDQTSIDNRQAMTCTNAKAARMILYMIQVNTGADPTSMLLQNCASDPSKFFLLTSSSQIVTTFNQIGTALSSLRVSKLR